MTTDPKPHDDVSFLAEICWLGPIIGPPLLQNGEREVRIAGAENPALGKCFGAAVVPVKTEGLRFRGEVAAAIAVKSDRFGWFAIDAEASLWKGFDGVLVVLLYNESSRLEYYAYEDYDPKLADDKASPKAAISCARSFARILQPMPEELKPEIKKAIAKAVKKLLDENTAEDLLDGLAKLQPAEQSEFECSTDAGAPVDTPPQDAKLVIAVASCQYPTAMLESVVAGASYTRLAARLSADEPHPPQCLLLVGDQIYVDGTAGFFDPTSQFDRFVRPYEILFRMKGVRAVRRQLPAFMMMDDHECQNNWEPRVDDARIDPVMVNGRRSYLTFQRRAGPEQQMPVEDSRSPLWYPFQVNGFPLFMADTRTERTPRVARTRRSKHIDGAIADHRARDIEAARIMSNGQMSTLLGWLSRQPAATPKIVASPAILLPRHARAVTPGVAISARALHSDGWDGYPGSLYQVLAHVAREQIPNVVFVSGDEHLSCVARVELQANNNNPVVVHSVHCSPLFAPFPFANTLRADFLADEKFKFPTGDGRGSVACSVETEFAPPGDGFTLLRFFHDRGGWMMHCEFDRAHEKDEGATIIKRELAPRVQSRR